MALAEGRMECKMAGWDNGSMSYMNNDKTRKASRGPDGEE